MIRYSCRTQIIAICIAFAALTGSQFAAASNSQLETIVITGKRRAEPARESPASITVVDRDALKMVSAVHISEALTRVPGAWISRGNGQEHLTAIRSPVFTGAGSCGAFYFAEDNIPLRPPGFCNVNELSEVNSEQAERIEVLRGPGNAVHGANAQHGLINVISRAAPDDQESSVSLSGGPHQYAQLLASYGDRFESNRYRLSLNIAHDDGYKDSSGYQQQKFNYRHEISGEKLQFESLLSYVNLDQDTAGFIVGEDAYRHADRKRENPNPDSFRDNHAARWYGRFSYTRDNGDELSVTPYFRYQDMEFLQHFLQGQPLEENGVVSTGWQSDWRTQLRDNLEIIAGIDADFSRGELKETQYQTVTIRNDLPLGKHYDYVVDSLDTAAFTQISWEPLAKLKVEAGVRIERQHYAYDNRMLSGATRDDDTPCGAPGNPVNCRYARPEDRDDSFVDPSYHAGLSRVFGTDQVWIFNYAHGFRPPQTAELYRLQSGQRVAAIDSEQIDSVETGWRGSLSTFDYELIAFYMWKDGVIFQDAERRNVNDAKTDHAGVEFSFAWQFADGWNIASSGTWARHRYTNDVALQGLPPGTSIDGNDIDTAPRMLASTRLSWQPRATTSAELEWLHLGRHYLEPTNTFEYPGHDLIHLRIRHQLTRHVEVAARITNLSDHDYAERADYAFGDYRYFVGEPRSLFLEVAWQQ